MTREEYDRMTGLCEKIAKEHDPAKFQVLVRELNELMEATQQRIEPEPHAKAG